MRTKDRLAELQRAAEAGAGGGGVYNTTTVLVAAEPDAAAVVELPAGIDAIFQEVERMHNWIHEISGNTQLIRRLHSDPTFHTNKHLQEQLDACVARSHAAAVRLGDALRRFEPATTATTASGASRGSGASGASRGSGASGASNDACARIARLQYACARRRYADALALHHAALDALRHERRRLLHDQIQLTNLEITEEECERLLDSRNMSLFVDNVRLETAAARGALRDAEARGEELARLEAALTDVRDLFAHLALLVAAQQERVDSVEYYALQATEHVESGQHQLLRGTVTRTKARKKKLSLIICLSTGFLVVLLVLVFT